VNLGAAALLEGTNGGALRSAGLARAVEAGWLIPGGSLFAFEVGVRGAVMEERAQAEHELGLFGGARLDLMHRRGSLMPFLRGGLGAVLIRIKEERFGLGPYFGAGLSWELWAGIALAFEGTAHTRISPFTLALGGAITILVQSF
jgi:hypothetical protein